LEAIFPGETPERIVKALEVGHDMSGAVDFLLCDQNDSECSTYIKVDREIFTPPQKFGLNYSSMVEIRS
jgi:hypothetical protein